MTVRQSRGQTAFPCCLLDRQLRYGTGIQYQINRDVTAGVAWEFMDAGPAPYSARRGPLAGTLQGHLSTDYLNFVGAERNLEILGTSKSDDNWNYHLHSRLQGGS